MNTIEQLNSLLIDISKQETSFENSKEWGDARKLSVNSLVSLLPFYEYKSVRFTVGWPNKIEAYNVYEDRLLVHYKGSDKIIDSLDIIVRDTKTYIKHLEANK